MPYGLISLLASVLLNGLYLFTDEAWWSKVLVAGLLPVSMAYLERRFHHYQKSNCFQTTA